MNSTSTFDDRGCREVPRLTARDVIATYLALRTGLWCDPITVRAAALSHGIGLAQFVDASAKMLVSGEIVARADGRWSEGVRA